MSINPELLLHPSDKAALKALKAIPGFTQLTKAYMNLVDERQMNILNKSSKLQLGPDQMPEYYQMLPPICQKLGIAVPELYMELDVVPNAYTYGDTHPFIVLTSGLLETMPEELIPTVIAHECGHIACRHTLYNTMGRFLLNGMGRYLGGLASLISVPIEIAYAYWRRCSEFSADRAAVICDGTAEKMAEVCFRFAGNDKDIHATTSLEAFLRQAEDYRTMVKDDKWNKTLEFLILASCDHPLNSVRALECREWAATEQYARIGSLLQYQLSDGKNCDIPVPESSKGCMKKDRDAVRELFLSSGFNNLEFVRIYEKGPAVHPGQVVSALIDQTTPFEKGEWISSDAHIVFTFYEPETAEEAASAHPGQVLVAENAYQYIGKNHYEVAGRFREMGFSRVKEEETVLKRNWMIREGGVTEISIDGDDQFMRGEWFPEDAEVRILYAKYE